MNTEKKVVVAVPAGDTVHTEFAACLCDMLLFSVSANLANSITCATQFYSSSILPYSRQVLAQYLLDLNFTHILFIDSDMHFPHTLLASMLKHDKPIMGINAMSRRPLYRCTAQEAPGIAVRTNLSSTGLEQVFRTGFGIMWVAAEVFRKMPEPWFEFEWQSEHKVFKGEDYAFCEKARKLGYEVWIDHDISKQVEHMGSFGYTPLLRDALDAPMQEQATQRMKNVMRTTAAAFGPE